MTNKNYNVKISIQMAFSEEFNTGFGSHTPMVLGQAKVFRYFPNFDR